MNEKIEETLKRLVDATSKGNSPTTSNTESGASQANQSSSLGDPNCPVCGGAGYLRVDVPVGHPEFGKLEICACRQDELLSRVRDRLFRLSQLDELKLMTFDTFVPQGRVGIAERESASLEQAFNHARLFAERPDGWLLLQGGYGCGKTHLAAAIANACVDQGVPALFLTVPDLLDSLRFTFNNAEDSFEERFEHIRHAPLLILDDFGTQNATEWAREKLFQILNYRYTNRLPMVITTNLALREIEGRMRSRLSDPEMVAQVLIYAPDYRRPKEDSRQDELSSLDLHAGQTFGTFSLRKNEKLSADELRSLDKAFEAARQFSEDPEGWLVLTGPYGSGKTHLAAAIANFRALQGHPVTFVVVPDLLDHLRATFSPSSDTSYDRRFEQIRGAQVLVLDDLGTQAMTPWVREKLYQLFNHRYNAGLPTVITTADTLDDIDPRLRTRMLDARLCVIHAITAPAFHGARRRKRS
ncbi:MAG: ATP-binding protein [Anaerolineales bacterium]|jgi:DNA replication protein DnaC